MVTFSGVVYPPKKRCRPKHEFVRDEKLITGIAKARKTFQKHLHAEYALWGRFTEQGDSVVTFPGVVYPLKKGGVKNMSL